MDELISVIDDIFSNTDALRVAIDDVFAKTDKLTFIKGFTNNSFINWTASIVSYESNERDVLSVDIDVFKLLTDWLIYVIDDVFANTDAFNIVIDDIFASVDVFNVVIDDVFAMIDALKFNVELFTFESRFDTDVLSDKTGRIKYLFNKYKDFALTSTLAAIMYIIIL